MGSKSGGCNSSTRDDINNKISNNKIGEKLDYWREYFKRANSDIFDIIENAIMVAASDCPEEYRVRKAGIAELLFTCRLTRCLGCDRVELAVSQDDHGGAHGHGHDHDGVVKNCFINDADHGAGGSKGSKVNSPIVDDDDDDDVDVHDDGDGGGDDDDVHVDIDGNEGAEAGLIDSLVDPGSNFTFADAEALNDLIEEERQLINEVLRIKDVLYNSQDESASVIFESLRRLQLMHLNINILKETEIGKAVNRIKKHSSEDICQLSRSLIQEWKIIVDEWVKSTQELAITEGGTPDSINPSTVDEDDGLASPPMDDGFFLTSQDMDFNQFFDGVDDNGNPRNCNNRRPDRKPCAVKPDAPKRREEPPKGPTAISKDNIGQRMVRQQPLPKPSKPSITQSGPGRPLKPSADVKVSKDLKVQPKLDKPVIQRRPAPQPETLRSSREDSVQDKLAATKRKLQERYQQAENAKRQRTIQVMEIQDLPKQGLVNRNPHGRFGNNNRHRANGRK